MMLGFRLNNDASRRATAWLQVYTQIDPRFPGNRAERNLLRRLGRCTLSCKSLSSESGFHRGCCVRVSLCVIAFFCVRVRFRSSVDTSDWVQLSCRRCGKLRSFLSSAIAPDTFLREVPLAVVVSSSAEALQTRTYLVRIPRRKGHSIQRRRAVGSSCAPVTTSTVAFELAQTGGISIRRGGPDRTTFADLASVMSPC